MSVDIRGTTGITAPGFSGSHTGTYSGDGAGLSNTGAMLQFQHTLFTGTSTNSSITDINQGIAGLTVSITPKFANSKMKVEVRWGGETTHPDNILFNIKRNGVLINLPDAYGTNPRGLAVPPITYANNNNSTPEACSFFTVDTPNTLSPITYELNVVGYAGGSVTVYTGRCVNTSNTQYYQRMSCEITVTEIAG